MVEIYQEEASAAGETNSPQEGGGMIHSCVFFFFNSERQVNGLLGYHREDDNECRSIICWCMQFGFVL